MQNNLSKIQNNKKIFSIIIVLIMILIVSALFLTFGIKKGNWNYSLSQRIPKLVAIILTGFTISFSTIIFQTTTNNRLLTPNVMGLDSFYVFVQTVIIFIFSSSSIFVSNSKLNFILSLVFMVVFSTILYGALFKFGKSNVILIILVGIIFGTLFGSLSKFMQIIIDPNEYDILQNKLFASFNNINVDILTFSLIMIIIIILFILKDIKYLDVMSLGRDYAINLGVDYDRFVKKFFIVVSIFTAISTALVGPITFLGLLVVNVTKQVVRTYRHNYLIVFCVLISVFVLVLGQFLLERVLKLQAPVSVIINFIGGIYFIYLLFKESKLC